MKGTITSSPMQTSSIHFETSSSSKPVMQPVNELGWGLPVRRRTIFTDKQRKLLYDIFIEREESGKKVFPQEAHLQIRKSLKPEEYVTSQQIKSLFSRWSQLEQKGKLIDVENSKEHEDDSYLLVLSRYVKFLTYDLNSKLIILYLTITSIYFLFYCIELNQHYKIILSTFK